MGNWIARHVSREQAYGCRVDESIAQRREQPQQQRGVHNTSICVVS